MANIFDSDILFRGTCTFLRGIAQAAGSVTNAMIASAAGINATKLEHQHSVNVELYGPAVTIAALTKLVFACRGATATVISVKASIYVAADDVSRTVHVDIQKSTGGGAFATIMTATVSITNGTAIFTPVAGTINSGALVAGDVLQCVVTVAGGSGNQAKGLMLEMHVREDAD